MLVVLERHQAPGKAAGVIFEAVALTTNCEQHHGTGVYFPPRTPAHLAPEIVTLHHRVLVGLRGPPGVPVTCEDENERAMRTPVGGAGS